MSEQAIVPGTEQDLDDGLTWALVDAPSYGFDQRKGYFHVASCPKAGDVVDVTTRERAAAAWRECAGVHWEKRPRKQWCDCVAVQVQQPDETLARSGATQVEEAGRAVLYAAARGDSAFTSGTSVWTQENARELIDRFVAQPDISGSSFDDKLAKQLAEASEGATQLFAELYYLDLLPLSDYRAATKRACLQTALAAGGVSIALPTDLDAALEHGVFNGGVAFKTRRFWQLCYLVEFAVGFTALPTEERLTLLDEPRAFREALDTWTTVSAQSQRFGLLYLTFPSFFLPIVKGEHRDLIRQSYAYLVDDQTGDPDDDLRRAYDALRVKAGGGHVDLYQAPYREQWDPKAKTSKTYIGDLDKWRQFLHWASRLAKVIDLGAEERDYKLVMAARLDAVRTELLEGTQGWPQTLRSALNSANLLHQQFRIALFNDLRDHEEQLREVLISFWRPDADPERLDQLRAELRAMNPQSAYTPGNCTALGSVLLMARDVSQFPPYLPTPVAKACELTGQHNDVATPHTRYDTMLQLCAQTVERAPEVDIELQDLLDAQGLIWTVVKRDAPSSWSEAERTAFRAWRGDTVAEDETGETKRAWLVRGSSVNGRDLVPTWRARGSVSLAATKLRVVDSGLSREELKSIVEADYSQASYAAKAAKVDEFHAFLTRMQLGDVVATTSQGRLYLGTVTGDPSYGDSKDGRSNLRRPVQWTVGEGIDYADVPSEVSARLQVQHEVVEMTQQLRELEELMLAPASTGIVPVQPVNLPPKIELRLPNASQELADKLHVGKDWLDESIQLLRDRKQLIFYGPPGTGKTYVALQARRSPRRRQRATRPVPPGVHLRGLLRGLTALRTTGGFELKPGPLRKIVDQAQGEPGDAVLC